MNTKEKQIKLSKKYLNSRLKHRNSSEKQNKNQLERLSTETCVFDI